ncbi:MAG: hypothetical protein JWO40_578 [Candidatus Doudnabacteria bacterium]|nr:hypothetical protein [Candidatus Doudnabacteria bacterium]
MKFWILSIALFSSTLALVPQRTLAVNSILSGQICTPDNSTANSGNNIARCVNNIYAFSIAIGGFVAVLMFVIAGYFYTLGGNENVTKAKGFINSTIIGLILLFGSFALLNTIDPNLTSLPAVTAPGVNCDSQTDPVTKKVYNSCDNPDEYGQLLTGTSGGSVLCTIDNKNLCNDAIPTQQVSTQDRAQSKPNASEGGDVNNTFALFPPPLKGRFSQEDPRWGNKLYGNCGDGSTIGSSGCGPSAMAMVISHFGALGKVTLQPQDAPAVAKVAKGYGSNVDPGIIADIGVQLGYRVCGSGTSYQMFTSLAKYYGLHATQVGSMDEAKAAMKNGDVIIAAMGPGYFTTGGHFIVLYSYSGDKIYISDSGPRNRTIALDSTVEQEQHYMVAIGKK